jgi:hypothetical protein
MSDGAYCTKMKFPKRIWLFLGFAVSVISVVVNTFIISGINDESSDTKQKHAAAQARLVELSTELSTAELKFDIYKVMHYVALNTAAPHKQDARDDAKYMLMAYLAKNYGAANGIPAIDLFENTTIEQGQELETLKKVKDILARAEAEKDPKKLDALEKELDAVNTDLVPLTELGKKLEAARQAAAVEETSTNQLEWELGFLPTAMEFREKTLASIKAQKDEVRKHQAKLDELSQRSNLANYLGVALQMLGLLLVMGETLMADREEKEPKAKEEPT